MPQQLLEDIQTRKKFIQQDDGSLFEVEEITEKKPNKEGFLENLITIPPIPGFKGIFESGKTPEIPITTRSLLQTGGSLVGGLVGATGGPVAPAAVPILGMEGFYQGSALDEFLRRKFPTVFGESTGSYIPSGLETAIEAGSNIFPAAKLGRNAIARTLAQRMSKPLPEAGIKSLEILERTGTTIPQFTVGTPGGMARSFEDILGPERKEIAIKQALADVRQGVKETTGLNIEKPLPSRSGLGKISIRKSRASYFSRKVVEDADWEDFRTVLPKRKINKVIEEEPSQIIDPTTGKIRQTKIPTKIETIEAPIINIPNAVDTALKHKTTIDNLFVSEIGDVTTNRIKREYAEVKNTIETILTPIKHFDENIQKTVNLPAIDFENAKRIVSSINRLNKGELRKSEAGGILQDLVNNINKDFENQFSKEVFEKFIKAKKTTSELHRVFPKEIRKAINVLPIEEATAVKAPPSEFFDTILQNPEMLEAFIEGAGKRTAKAAVLTRLISSAASEKTPGALDTVKLLNAFKGIGGKTYEKQNELLRRVLTKDERQRIEAVFTVANNISPELQMAGRVAAAIREGGLAVTGLSGVFGALLGQKFGSKIATAGAGLTLLFSGRQFVDKVLLDPHFANYTIRGLKAPTNSKEALDATRGLLKAFKGTEAIVLSRTKDGKERQVGTIQIP